MTAMRIIGEPELLLFVAVVTGMVVVIVRKLI
jgi:hypothetical protein